MKRIHVSGIGVVAPGLGDWQQAAAVLRGEVDYMPAPIPRLAPALLPPNERRRATLPTCLALAAACQATGQAGVDIRTLPSVFASADGDMDLIDRLCRGIAAPPVALSPTLFHNSVHNAVAGYWSIGSHCMAPSTSLAAWDGTLAAGLIESATQLATECREILLVAYDVPAPPLLDAHRHFETPFACALVLDTKPCPAHLATLEIRLETAQGTADHPLPPLLETMRRGNPAARALPLLRAIARGQGETIRLSYLHELDLCLAVECPTHAP